MLVLIAHGLEVGYLELTEKKLEVHIHPEVR